MHCTQKIAESVFWVGASDRRLDLFENVFPLPKGVSYNSYLVMDQQTVLLDTVDQAVGEQFFENIDHVLAGRDLDYLIVNHMEPDHCATMNELVARYANVKIVGNSKTVNMIKQFFDFDIDSRIIVVKENDLLNSGEHTFRFIMAPMVHWPEVMVTYETSQKMLFTADAFGTFGAINGNLFADQVDFEHQYLDEARRYYCNIVGKYGPQTLSLLNKAANLDIAMLCPLHGPVWRENISWFIDKYQLWGSYTPEDQAVMIAYASVYGHTENAMDILAAHLSELGIKQIVMYDVSRTHPGHIVAEAFRCSHLVLASTTYNNEIFCNMQTALIDLKEHNLQNRTVALIENGTWAPRAGQLMRELLASMPNMTIIEPQITIKSALKKEQRQQLEQLAKAIADSI